MADQIKTGPSLAEKAFSMFELTITISIFKKYFGNPKKTPIIKENKRREIF